MWVQIKTSLLGLVLPGLKLLHLCWWKDHSLYRWSTCKDPRAWPNSLSPIIPPYSNTEICMGRYRQDTSVCTILAVGAWVKSHNIMSWVNILTAWLESLSYRRCSAGPVTGWSSTWMPTSDCRQQRLSKNYDVSVDQDQNFRNIWEVCWNIWSSLYLTLHYCSLLYLLLKKHFLLISVWKTVVQLNIFVKVVHFIF